MCHGEKSQKEKKNTLIWLTSLTGEPVMVVIIIQDKKAAGAIEFGHVITVDLYFPGGPVCHFKGKDVPAVIQRQKNGSITPTILVEVLKTLDH